MLRMTKEKLDVIIFGATGFTGKYTVFEAASVLGNLRWGIAGRNQAKLQSILEEMGAKAKQNLMDTPIVIADVGNEASLLAMAQRCRVLVNCCGPYRFFGEPVVRACIEAGTHHVDVTGETQFMESMQLKYHAKAQERNTYIVSGCGFDSIPSEIGILYAEKNFDGTINSVETYLKTVRKRSPKSAGIHYGTWESLIHAIGHLHELKDIRPKLFSEKLPKFQPKAQRRPPIFKSEVVDRVCLPFPGPDSAVAARTQRFRYQFERKRPAQVNSFVAFGSWIEAIIVGFMAIVYGIMAQFSFTRKLLLDYPRLFTFGFVSHEGPSEIVMNNTHFSFTIKALGWAKSSNLAEPTDQYKDAPNKSVVVKVSGTNPGYGATCVALLSTAVTILKESDKMPSTGGVLTPGAAFAKTSIIEELQKHEHGLKFEVLNK
ncbi:saccharopine dehydrogenase-like oxidoreductase [Teleopsis dalmanni]|uniref:saccharopine dehydrogenase-like oxidoreductase n=1 Tax=Teleopsis dalmanni TaxID=139649 RepID=UPI0018CD19A2|nr:saccharopine dehydrogenase-like oxidoreductase [Teleopsis dalmanni]